MALVPYLIFVDIFMGYEFILFLWELNFINPFNPLLSRSEDFSVTERSLFSNLQKRFPWKPGGGLPLKKW
jgi:hypothetical protein